jgi:hypothetical protein
MVLEIQKEMDIFVSLQIVYFINMHNFFSVEAVFFFLMEG